jgi:hypothetical protein
MKNKSRQGLRISLLISCVLVVSTTLPGFVAAQSQEMRERVAEVKEAAARNKQALAQYTWVQQVTISLKGEQKKQEHFQVRLGPDGKPQKQSLDPPPAPPKHEGRLKKHIVEKKKEEYREYADRIKELIQQYVPPERDLLEQAYQKGNIMVGPEPGASGQYRLLIPNYIKQGDKMTLVVDKTQKELLSLSIATYLDDPKDAVNVSVVFAQVPGGPNHVSGETINGVSKQLTIGIQNSNYQRL